jgi:hypothetical protein
MGLDGLHETELHVRHPGTLSAGDSMTEFECAQIAE